ncbi:hypothetical protein D3C84_943230 [compost metagenome]
MLLVSIFRTSKLKRTAATLAHSTAELGKLTKLFTAPSSSVSSPYSNSSSSTPSTKAMGPLQPAVMSSITLRVGMLSASFPEQTLQVLTKKIFS